MGENEPFIPEEESNEENPENEPLSPKEYNESGKQQAHSLLKQGKLIETLDFIAQNLRNDPYQFEFTLSRLESRIDKLRNNPKLDEEMVAELIEDTYNVPDDIVNAVKKIPKVERMKKEFGLNKKGVWVPRHREWKDEKEGDQPSA